MNSIELQKKNNNSIKLKKSGEFLFKLGIFLLSSAFSLASFFLIISLIISFMENYKNFLKEKVIYILIFCSLLMIISSISNYVSINEYSTLFTDKEISFNKFNIWLDMFNWIPMFLCFWGFQYYLDSPLKRKNLLFILLAGSVPVIFSCIIQYFFEVYGPFSTLGGLIIWFQKPINHNHGVSGLFSNQNYTGFWLSVVWSISLGFIYLEKSSRKKKIITIIFSSIIAFLTILTTSRNALLGSILPIPIIFGIKGILFLIALIILLSILSLTSFQLVQIETPAIEILTNLFEKITKFDFNNFYNYERVDIWIKTFLSIAERPLLGWGATTFYFILLTKNPIIDSKHTHNIILQLAYNYGIPTAIILTTFVINLLIKNIEILRYKSNSSKLLINKIWFSTSLVALLSQIFDITYFDGKVSILIWVLLAGLNCIKKEKKINSGY